VNVDPRDIVLEPVISEKSMADMRHGCYTFVVHPDANKVEIKKAVEEIFDVKVRKVNTMRVSGKSRRMGVFTGKTSNWKKAKVTLEEGETIKFFEGMM